MHIIETKNFENVCFCEFFIYSFYVCVKEIRHGNNLKLLLNINTSSLET
jgi:hypothetical protein